MSQAPTVSKSHCWAGLCSFSLSRWQRRTAETRALSHPVKHWEVKWLLTGPSCSQEGMGQEPRGLHPSLLLHPVLYQENAVQGRERPQGRKAAFTEDGTLDAVWVTTFTRVRVWHLDRLEHTVSRLGSHTVGKHLPWVVWLWVINTILLCVCRNQLMYEILFCFCFFCCCCFVLFSNTGFLCAALEQCFIFVLEKQGYRTQSNT